jgi:hypothetical protein
MVATVSCILIKAGGTQALQAAQSASIIIGLPLNILALYAMQCVYLFCKKVQGSETHGCLQFHGEQRGFVTPIYGGMFNVIEYIFSLGKVHESRVRHGMDLPSVFQLQEFVKAVFLPFWPLYQVLHRCKSRRMYQNVLIVMLYSLLQVLWIGMLPWRHHEMFGLVLFFFILAGVVLAVIRYNFRLQYDLRSNLVGDLVSSTIFWPQVIVQMREESLLGVRLTKSEHTEIEHTMAEENV